MSVWGWLTEGGAEVDVLSQSKRGVVLLPEFAGDVAERSAVQGVDVVGVKFRQRQRDEHA